MVKLFESFSNSKINLELPQIIKWYTCGPTVYADSHLGHARTFITFDILRRYLESIGHTVLYCMNITDIDDKILHKVKMLHWTNLLKSKNIFSDIINEDLMLKYFNEEDLWPSKELFYEFVDREEEKFWNDMRSINVKDPFAKIRVTSVQNEILDFISELVTKKFAYISKSGSVYFDTQKYNEIYPTQAYISLHKETNNELNLKNKYNDEKKHPHDFSLWKSAKKYEISFDSPFSKGRVSWHTECSVMIKKLFGNEIDIHSGGIDLKYPHHHNECIQTTAITEKQKWIKYFLHCGHLHINNEKMSKSLTNFITIKNFLDTYNYKVLRLIFMNSRWNEILDFNIEIINDAVGLDKRINNLYAQINSVLKTKKIKHYIDSNDTTFIDIIQESKNKFIEYWENFNTQAIVAELRNLIIETNKYLSTDYNITNIISVKNIINNQLQIIGIEYDICQNKEINNETLIETIIEIRDKIKKINTFTKKELFNLSDWIRDVKMKSFGIQLKDEVGETKWNYV